MSYKIPNVPSPKAYKEELADFWEIQALCSPGQYVSSSRIAKSIAVGSDEIGYEGIESEDDELDSRLDEVFLELQRRQGFSSGKYPFSFKKYSMKLNEEASLNKTVYLFLLLCTRFNMKTSKVHNEIDGTLLFEELCTDVIPNYFGKTSKSYLFGTASSDQFEKRKVFEGKVNKIITKIGEGNIFRNLNSNTPSKNDDAVDVVVWKDFADNRIGKLIAFGQCKTGTTWQKEIHRLKPDDFCDKWFQESPVFDPLPLIFICDTLNEDFNFYTSQKGFLLFNRFRILEQTEDNLNSEIQTKIQSWLDGAMMELN